MIRDLLVVLILAAALGGCAKVDESLAAGTDGKSAATQRPLLISAEDLLTVRSNALTSGPSITGSIQPERRADLRAEVSAVVLKVLKENGDTVKRGDLLVRLDDTAIRDSLTSAEASARAADQAYQQAERQFQRLSSLKASGVVSAQEVEDVEIRRNNAQSDREAAKTSAVLARQQLQRTEARAPFDGIVSDRKVSAGDTAQIGKELVKVIDPSSMRFEGMVSADDIGQVEAGQPVLFRVHGYADQAFQGKVARVNPAANATTRQVEVLVEFADSHSSPSSPASMAKGGSKAAALPASRFPLPRWCATATRPSRGACRPAGCRKFSWSWANATRAAANTSSRAALQAGDQLLRYPTATLQNGQRAELAQAPKSSATLR